MCTRLHSIALARCACGGDNSQGQIGDNSTTDRRVPTTSSLSNVAEIAAGEYHTVVRLTTGDVYTWGNNSSGQLGIGSTTQSLVPVLVTTGAIAIGAGQSHTLVVKSDGTVWGAGINSNAQLGDTTTTSPRTSLVQMAGVANATAVAGGQSIHSSYSPTARSRRQATAARGRLATAGPRSAPRPWPSARSRVSPRSRRRASQHRAQVGWHGLDVGIQQRRSAWRRHDDQSPFAVCKSPRCHRWHPWRRRSTHPRDRHERRSSSPGAGTTPRSSPTARLVNRSTPAAISGASYDWRVATPTLSLTPALYLRSTGGRRRRYARRRHPLHENGVDPTNPIPTVAPGGTITVSTSQTLKAKAWKSGMPESGVAVRGLRAEGGAAHVQPGSRDLHQPRTVTMARRRRARPSATRPIRPSRPPARRSTTAPIEIATTTTLKAVAFKPSGPRARRPGIYTMNFGTLSPPTADPAPAGTRAGDGHARRRGRRDDPLHHQQLRPDRIVHHLHGAADLRRDDDAESQGVPRITHRARRSRSSIRSRPRRR